MRRVPALAMRGDPSAGLGPPLALEASLPRETWREGASSPITLRLLVPGGGHNVSPPHGFPQKQPLVAGHGKGHRVASVPHSPPWCWACGLLPGMMAPEGASSTLPGGRDSLVLTFPSRLLHYTSATPSAGFGGKQGAHLPVPAIGARLAMAPHALPAKMSRQPLPPLMRVEKMSREKEGRKETKIDNGFFLFAFCSLSHGFQFYSPTTKSKTFFFVKSPVKVKVRL